MSARAALAQRIEAERERIVAFLQAFVRVDTSNPPGDTREGAALIRKFLDENGLPYRVVAPQDSMPNIVGHFDGGAPGRHLVLNGHIDVFPAGDRALWSRDPLCGDIVDGRVFGRGTVDMKCGTTASLFTYAYLHSLREHLKGKLTLTVVSDEETGGRWGTGWLIDNLPDEVLGDCVLNGEPSSPWTVRFGEKAMLWFKFKVSTPGAHGAYPHLSASATKIAARLIRDLEALEEIVPQIPDNVAKAVERPEVRAAVERGLGKGANETMKRLTVNIGVVQGGVKVNMLPGQCIVEADVRLPVGIDKDHVIAEVRRILTRYPEVEMTLGKHTMFNATWSDPDGEMLKIVQDNAEASIKFRPPAIVTLGGTDCRFWRAKGVPAYVYGCSPDRMGAPDESVPIDELMHVVRTHALSAFDYLTRG